MKIDIESWIKAKKQPNSVMIILNQPIDLPYLFDKAWDACEHRVVADGAAKHLRNLKNDKYIPDFIVGDLDSISDEDKDYYKSKGVKLLTRKSQESTDFMKSMAAAHEEFDVNGKLTPRTFFAFGGVGGRLDHTWSSFLCLNLAAEKGDRLFLISDKNVTFLLTKGDYSITTPQTEFGEAVGYVPLEGTCTVTTKGLMWDVTNEQFSFTTHLSTSNYLVADEVEISVENKTMFTIQIKDPK